MKKNLTCAALFMTAAIGTASDASARDARPGHYWACGQYLDSGVATYYANKFVGRKTASGEIFQQANLTAASLSTDTVPFSRSRNRHQKVFVKVVAQDTGRSIIVDVNDLGADNGGVRHEKRIIDLTTTGIKRLGVSGNPDVDTYLCRELKIPVPMPRRPEQPAPVRKPLHLVLKTNGLFNPAQTVPAMAFNTGIPPVFKTASIGMP